MIWMYHFSFILFYHEKFRLDSSIKFYLVGAVSYAMFSLF